MSPFLFDGFDSPSYTPCPDALFDFLLPELSESELKVLLYVVRRTFGFHKDADAISIAQMVNGITTRDGRVLDRGTGLSKSSVRRGVQGLLDKGVLLVDKVRSDDGDYETNVYALRFKQGVVPNSNHPGVKLEPRVVPNSNPQETGKQET
ncbi:MAG TPA: replication protein, partial [Bryobacteraceae bacterium]